MRTRLYLLIATFIFCLPATTEAGPATRSSKQKRSGAMRPVKKAGPAATGITSPHKEARRRAAKTVEAKKPTFNGRPCICHDAELTAAIGELSLRVQQSKDGRAYASAVCWVHVTDIKTAEPGVDACSDFEALER